MLQETNNAPLLLFATAAPHTIVLCIKRSPSDETAADMHRFVHNRHLAKGQDPWKRKSTNEEKK